MPSTPAGAATLLVSALEGLTDLQTLEFHRIQLTASDTKTLSQNISRLLTLQTIKIQSFNLDESAYDGVRGHQGSVRAAYIAASW